jgi:hypothetical protein
MPLAVYEQLWEWHAGVELMHQSVYSSRAGGSRASEQ